MKEEERRRREYKSPEEQQREAEREAQLSFVESWPRSGKFDHLPVLQYREHLPRCEESLNRYFAVPRAANPEAMNDRFHFCDIVVQLSCGYYS